MKTFGFPKPEHLCLQKDIDDLFAAGSRSAVAFPLRAVWRQVSRSSGPQVKVLLSVPKRKLHHAVDRNRAKRQLREAYRLQKHLFVDALSEHDALHIAFLWLSDKPVDSSLVHARVGSLLQRIAEKCRKGVADEASSKITD